MKHFTLLVAIIAVCFSVSLAAAQNKVVVIPLNSAKKLNNVVTVSAKGGDFTDPVAAVNSITDATEANPYLVLIGPGVYTLTQTLVMKPYVTITGSGRDATTLTGAISSGVADATSAIVSGADNATLCGLTIENNGGGDYSIALYNKSSSPIIIHDVTANVSGGVSNYGVYSSNSSPRMTDVTANASGGTNNRGVYNSGSSSIMTGVTANASGGTESLGVYNYYSPGVRMINVTANASGGTSNRGVLNSVSSPIMTGVTATASGGTSNRGVANHSSSPIIRHSTLEGTPGLFVSVGTTRIMHSSISGGITRSSGTLICAYLDDVNTEVGITCP